MVKGCPIVSTSPEVGVAILIPCPKAEAAKAKVLMIWRSFIIKISALASYENRMKRRMPNGGQCGPPGMALYSFVTIEFAATLTGISGTALL
jgi:hypothetical protein